MESVIENLLKRCQLEPKERSLTDEENKEDEFEKLPCRAEFRLRAEDEISIDSIISAILARIEPSEEELGQYTWNLNAKDEYNEKQALLFEEKLYISKLEDATKLCDQNKIFMRHELEEIGEFSLKVEESYDGYVVFSKSKMTKDGRKCGHQLKGKYDDKLVLIREERTEFDTVDNTNVVKTLQAHIEGDSLIAIRETKLNDESQKYKAVINIKGRDKMLLLDGGVMLLIRFLIVNRFKGLFEYYAMNLSGRIIRGVIKVQEIRKKVRVFYKEYEHAISVNNTQYFNGVAQEVSETFYTSHGSIVLHYWQGFNYLFHSTRKPPLKKDKTFPKLELMWACDDALAKKYTLDKQLNFEYAIEYLSNNSALADFLHDYLLCLLKYKPPEVLKFTVQYFNNMKNTF